MESLWFWHALKIIKGAAAYSCTTGTVPFSTYEANNNKQRYGELLSRIFYQACQEKICINIVQKKIVSLVKIVEKWTGIEIGSFKVFLKQYS